MPIDCWNLWSRNFGNPVPGRRRPCAQRRVSCRGASARAADQVADWKPESNVQKKPRIFMSGSRMLISPGEWPFNGALHHGRSMN